MRILWIQSHLRATTEIMEETDLFVSVWKNETTETVCGKLPFTCWDGITYVNGSMHSNITRYLNNCSYAITHLISVVCISDKAFAKWLSLDIALTYRCLLTTKMSRVVQTTSKCGLCEHISGLFSPCLTACNHLRCWNEVKTASLFKMLTDFGTFLSKCCRQSYDNVRSVSDN